LLIKIIKDEKMEISTKSLYLDLMKKTLTFALWEEPAFVPVDTRISKLPLLLRPVAHTMVYFLNLMNLRLYARKRINITPELREEGKIWPQNAHTMIGLKRLNNVQYCVENVIKNQIEGDLIETGVWRGGACIFMRAILAAYGITDRRIFVADSFEGLPKPDLVHYPQDSEANFHKHHHILAISKEEVEANFKAYGLLDEQVFFLKGWFKDTIPTAPINKLAVLRLDGDMYESTMEVLIHLYPKLSPGGFCIIDDYSIRFCRQAVDDFRTQLKITSPIQKIDHTGIFWQK
jgi:O-methyltransferase